MTIERDPVARADARLRRIGARPEDIEETFIRSSGPGGQNVNKVSTCVQLAHRPSGLIIRCQKERSQAANRAAARNLLADRLEALERARRLALQQAREKARRAARPRPRGVKERILESKRRRASLKRDRRVDHRDL